MNRTSLFLTLYRKKYAENILICLLFSLLGTAISMALFVQENNESLVQNQLTRSGVVKEADVENAMKNLSVAFENTENVLGTIAIAAVIVGVIGGLCLIGFRNQSAIKAIVMMHMFGMQKKDLVLKAAIDAFFFGVLSSVSGYFGGYFLFRHFSEKILLSQNVVRLFSVPALSVYWKALALNVFIVFWGNLYMDLKAVETPVTEYLYGRKGQRKGGMYNYVLMAEVIGIAGYSLQVFHVNRKVLLISGIVILLLAAVLFLLFHFFFGVFTKRKRRTMRINKPGDLSFCFLCSRNKRDAVLSIVISIGTIILCLATNILFNIGGILRSAYRDNMGYTSVVFVEDYSAKDEIGQVLDENGFTYTFGFSRLMNYSELAGMEQEEGQFWALLIGSQTDHNAHFLVPEGTFIGEKYFENCCNLISGESSAIFGEPLIYGGSMADNQYLSLVSYSFIVNASDWNLGIDDRFHPVYLMDVSVPEEARIKELLKGYGCHLDSASEMIDEIKAGMAEYLDLLAIVAGMIFLVTVTIFYTVISSDLNKRKTELYLYRIYGASFEKAQKVIFHEYLMMALVASLAVSFTVMFCGELYFYYGLRKHFPLSLPIMAATTGFAVLFIVLCCQLAGGIHARTAGLEAIRDE